jgi:hypothetical protein
MTVIRKRLDKRLNWIELGFYLHSLPLDSCPSEGEALHDQPLEQQMVRQRVVLYWIEMCLIAPHTIAPYGSFATPASVLPS